MSASPSPIVRLRIHAVAAGGDGVGRHDGAAVFVPFTATGDLVDVRLEPSCGGAVRGRLLEIVESGVDRRDPPCPVAGSCGGCHFQHLTSQAQSDAKSAVVRDTLRRIGGFDDPPLRPLVASPRFERYRRRLRVKLVKGGWGFSRRASHEVIRTSSCLLAEGAVEDLATRVATALRDIGGFGAIDDFAVDTLESGEGSLHIALQEPPSPRVQSRAARLLSAIDGLRGVVLTGGPSKGGGATAIATVGDPVLIDEAHHRLRVRPDLFAQANRLGARLLAGAVAETIEPGASVLELYAGAGTLTLAFEARAGELVATEGEGPSLDLLRLALSERDRKARLIGGPAKRVVDGLAADGATFDQVVLDPPRAGAREVLPALVSMKPKRITYVSCDPATFARDAAVLVRGGYRLGYVTPFDLFPQTFHTEVVGVFQA